MPFTANEIEAGRKLFAADWQFIAATGTIERLPPMTGVEVAFVGRSNVGKSSLINAMVGQDRLARTSRTPGRTRLVNWFEIGATPPFFLVDLPGYGYAEVSQAMRESWRPLIESYLGGRKTLAGVLLLIDVRRGAQDEELDFVPWLDQREIPLIVALTKADKLAKNKRVLEVQKVRRSLDLRRDPFAVSTLSTEGVDPLWRSLVGVVTKRVASI
jgi:GTP-binding protein